MEEGLSLVSEIRKTFALPGVDVRSYSPLALAYIGDDVYDVVVRTFVVEHANRSAHPGRHDRGAGGAAYGRGRSGLQKRTERQGLHHGKECQRGGLPESNGTGSSYGLSVSVRQNGQGVRAYERGLYPAGAYGTRRTLTELNENNREDNNVHGIDIVFKGD